MQIPILLKYVTLKIKKLIYGDCVMLSFFIPAIKYFIFVISILIPIKLVVYYIKIKYFEK